MCNHVTIDLRLNFVLNHFEKQRFELMQKKHVWIMITLEIVGEIQNIKKIVWPTAFAAVRQY